MVQKNRRKAGGKKGFLWGLATAAGMMAAVWCMPVTVLAENTGTVKVGSAKIRANTDTSSAVVGSASQGKRITLTGETKDASGVTWYQVYVDANTTGYIRADLVDRNDDGTLPQLTSGGGSQEGGESDAAQESGGDSSQAAGGAETAMDAQYAMISAASAKVRSGPSTNDSTVASLEKDSRVVVSGQSNGSDGKVWYYVTFTAEDGSEKSGFIRSDLLELGDMVPVPEEEAPPEPDPEPEPEPSVNNDYELVYQQEADGTYVWYLHDNVGRTKQKLQQILDAAAQAQSVDASEDAKVLVRQRIAIVALGILAGVLVIVIIVMAVKLRDAYYEDYEDDDDDDDDEEDEEDDDDAGIPSRRRRVQEVEETPARRRRSAQEDTASSGRRRAEDAPAVRTRPTRDNRKTGIREVEYQEDLSENVLTSSAPKRKAKNFLIDDDDLEFGFLNMEDKD